MATHEAPGFDEVIHAPQRLRICAVLNSAQKVEFGFLLNRLGLSKSALSKHLTQLSAAGYIGQARSVRDSRSRLWLSLTPEGERAYAAHIQALREIITADENASPGPRVN